MDSAQKTMTRMFNRHDKQVADFETLPDAEKRYISEKCPGFYAPPVVDEDGES